METEPISHFFVNLIASPWLTTAHIFLLFDYVHLLKCIRNNWLTEKVAELEFTVDGVKKVAKWDDLRKLHELECHKLVKMSKLSDVAVNPKPIERQKVSDCLKVFCKETSASLKLNSDNIGNLDDTVLFLNIFIEFWDIVNVHDKYTGIRTRDATRDPIRCEEDVRLQKLLNLASMVENMAGPQGKRVK